MAPAGARHLFHKGRSESAEYVPLARLDRIADPRRKQFSPAHEHARDGGGRG
jgi:hypothetical protein